MNADELRPIFRAPMRARDLEVPAGAGAEYGIAHGLVGIGPGKGEKAARMVHRFAEVPDGDFVWTRDQAGTYHLGRIRGPLREDRSPGARAVGIRYVRPAAWLRPGVPRSRVPPAVIQTFGRGGRNFQRTHDAEAERETADLWRALGPPDKQRQNWAPAILELETPHGPARVRLQAVEPMAGALILGHGAGGGIDAPDLAAAARAAGEASFSVALVEQPYRVAGRRSPAPASQLDAAWVAVVAQLRRDALSGVPLVVGGRSAGARVACRTVTDTGAAAVLCLAFPVHPPGRADDPSKSRLPELDAVELPALVVQGDRDPFGMPPEARNRKVVRLPGNHSLPDASAVEAAVSAWLDSVFRARAA